MNRSKYNPKYDPKYSKERTEKKGVDAKTNTQGPATLAVNAQPAQVANDKGSDAMLSEGGQSAADKAPHAVREPSSLTGGLPVSPEVRADSEIGEQVSGLSTKSVS